MSECLIYQLKPGQTMVCIDSSDILLISRYRQVGRLDSEKPAAIRLSGESIKEEHCYFENNDGKVTLYALPDAVTVSRSPNGPRIDNFTHISQFLNGRQIVPDQVSLTPFSIGPF